VTEATAITLKSDGQRQKVRDAFSYVIQSLLGYPSETAMKLRAWARLLSRMRHMASVQKEFSRQGL